MEPSNGFRALLMLLQLQLLLAPDAGSARPHGCLFDGSLCSHQERCVTDGLFGHCQDASLPVRIQYDVSPPVLGRLWEVLRQLLLQGLSWRDDITQYVIAMEMEKVPKLRLQHRLPAVTGDERFPSPAVKGQLPANAPLDQWPASEVRRYLKFILASGADEDPTYPLKGGIVVEPRSGFDGVSDPDYPSDHGRRRRPIHEDSRDQNLKQSNRIKDTNHGLSTLSPQAAALDADGLRQKKVSVPDGSRSRRKEMDPQIPVAMSPGQPGVWGLEQRNGEEAGTSITAGPRRSKETSSQRRQAPAVALAEPQEEAALTRQQLPKVGGGLQPEWAPTVISPGKEQYAYIVTNQKPLTLSDGIKLLESLALRLHLATVNFINISVIGPALTFRLRHNDNNLTVDEVAEEAAADKVTLEAETGLKIIQAGVGEFQHYSSQRLLSKESLRVGLKEEIQRLLIPSAQEATTGKK